CMNRRQTSGDRLQPRVEPSGISTPADISLCAPTVWTRNTRRRQPSGSVGTTWAVIWSSFCCPNRRAWAGSVGEQALYAVVLLVRFRWEGAAARLGRDARSGWTSGDGMGRASVPSGAWCGDQGSEVLGTVFSARIVLR